jgi:hypothetical protein
MILQVRAWGGWRSFWVRLIALMDVYLILNDWISLGYLIYLLFTLRNFLPLLQAIIVIWAFQLLVRPRAPAIEGSSPLLLTARGGGLQIFQAYTAFRLYLVGLYVPPEVVVFFSVYKVRARARHGRIQRSAWPCTLT